MKSNILQGVAGGALHQTFDVAAILPAAGTDAVVTKGFTFYKKVN